MSPGNYDPRHLAKPAEASLPPFSIHTVLLAARCWWHIALPMGLLMASAAAVVVYYMSTPTYTAQAWVMIKARPPVIIRDVSLDDPQKFVQNQIELMKSPLVMGPVSSDSGVANTPELVNEPDRAQYLRTHVRVKNQGGSDFFTLEFSSQSPEKAALVVNRVAQEYSALQDKYEKKLNNMTIERLRDQQRIK